MLSDAELIDLAGEAAFKRGRKYHAEGRVQITQQTADTLHADVRGSERYSLGLRSLKGEWTGRCSCPAAAGGDFCKHLVAAALTAREAEATGEAGPPTSDALLEFLRAQPAERLAGWLKTLADEDRDIGKRLRLYRAADDPAELKKALGKMLNAGGFLDYHGSMRYADRIGAVIDVLEAQLQRDPASCRSLGEYVIGRLLKIYKNADDSSGAIGDRLYEVGAAHARACAAAPPGKVLAKPLFKLQQKDDWGIVPLPCYWDALGVEGQAAYGQMIHKELAKLPAEATRANRYGEAFGIRFRAEAYARASGDFELLQTVLRWDLSYPHAHFRVLESLREYGREREALAWAETAVKQYPDDSALRNALAECLAAAGLDEEALEHVWLNFRQHAGSESWDALKRAAGHNWPDWRERALAEVEQREQGEVTLRVRLLLHDGDASTALVLAREHPVAPDTLAHLARRLEQDDPATSGAFYLRLARYEMTDLVYARYPVLVGFLRLAARLLPGAEVQATVTQVREQHARKTRLMALMNEAGL